MYSGMAIIYKLIFSSHDTLFSQYIRFCWIVAAVIFLHGSGKDIIPMLHFFALKNGMIKGKMIFIILFIISFQYAGSNGKEFMEYIHSLVGDDWKFPHIKVIIPTAPEQPYTMLNGNVIENSNFSTAIPLYVGYHTHWGLCDSLRLIRIGEYIDDIGLSADGEHHGVRNQFIRVEKVATEIKNLSNLTSATLRGLIECLQVDYFDFKNLHFSPKQSFELGNSEFHLIIWLDFIWFCSTHTCGSTVWRWQKWPPRVAIRWKQLMNT